MVPKIRLQIAVRATRMLLNEPRMCTLLKQTQNWITCSTEGTPKTNNLYTSNASLTQYYHLT